MPALNPLTYPPSIIISPPQGRSKLPIVELDRKMVLDPGKQIRLRKGSSKRAAADCSFGDFHSHLDIDAWEFFHAAKKTELTKVPNPQHIQNAALLFAAEYFDFFTWNSSNLRKVDRSVFEHEDFAEASLAGRFGEAVSYLTMVSLGYVFWDRIAVLWERNAHKSGMNHGEMIQQAKIIKKALKGKPPNQEPDFLFEKSNGETAFMESKGSFVHPVDDNPTTKADLQGALNQIAAWNGLIRPNPAKSFAIGTYFREQSDQTGDPSLIAFVDPPGDDDGGDFQNLEFPNDWVRRGNYGSWLMGMRLGQAGDALRRGLVFESSREIPLLVLPLAGRKFAIQVDGPLLEDSRFLDAGDFFAARFLDMLRWFRYHHPRYSNGSSNGLAHFWRDFLYMFDFSKIAITGIEVSNLRILEGALREANSTALFKIEPLPRNQNQDFSEEGFRGSIMPDGTLVGEVGREILSKATTEFFLL